MSKRIDLAVPFVEKDEAKQFAVQWDDENRVWWTSDESMCEELERWLPFQPTPDEIISALPEFRSLESGTKRIELMAQNCEFPEWMLLMLPGKLWGAFLRADLGTPAVSEVAGGNYAVGCRFVSNTPTDTLGYMREHRIYSGDLPNKKYQAESNYYSLADYGENHSLFCTGRLTIGDHTIEIQLPLSCATLIAHLDEDAPVLAKTSKLSLALFSYLDCYTPDSVKPPMADELALALEISQKLRVPISMVERERRDACVRFIDQHKSDLTLYRNIFTDLERECWPLAKQINNYVKWSTARTMLEHGVCWEVVGEALGIKTQATLDKYVAKAQIAEEETPELLTVPFYQELIKIGRNGESVDLALQEIATERTWDIFSQERSVRAVLRRRASEVSGEMG